LGIRSYVSKCRTTEGCEKTSVLFDSNIEKQLYKNSAFCVLNLQHITGTPRNQITFSSLEDTISLDNPIRFIDAFV
jgi:hypothetical protein